MKRIAIFCDGTWNTPDKSENEKNFGATLWHQQPDSKNQILKQVWFRGVHSDVGGGYLETETGLSDIVLKWMLDKARKCKLEFDTIDVNPNFMASMHESYRRLYTLLHQLFRPIGVKTGKGNTHESLHPTVIEKYINDENYRPRNLVEYFRQHPL